MVSTIARRRTRRTVFLAPSQFTIHNSQFVIRNSYSPLATPHSPGELSPSPCKLSPSPGERTPPRSSQAPPRRSTTQAHRSSTGNKTRQETARHPQAPQGKCCAPPDVFPKRGMGLSSFRGVRRTGQRYLGGWLASAGYLAAAPDLFDSLALFGQVGAAWGIVTHHQPGANSPTSCGTPCPRN